MQKGLKIRKICLLQSNDLTKNILECRGDGQVVSMLTMYSDNPSSNPAKVYNFCLFVKNEN